MQVKESIARINSFGSAQEAEPVQPEDRIFILTSSDLQRIIHEASEPLLARIKDLEDGSIQLSKKVSDLEAWQDLQEENQLIQLRLIADLRKGQELQPLQRDRGEILRLLIAANDGKMLAKDARKRMHLSESAFSLLVSSMKDYIITKPYHLKKNQNVLVLKSTLAKEERTF